MKLWWKIQALKSNISHLLRELTIGFQTSIQFFTSEFCIHLNRLDLTTEDLSNICLFENQFKIFKTCKFLKLFIHIPATACWFIYNFFKILFWSFILVNQIYRHEDQLQITQLCQKVSIGYWKSLQVTYSIVVRRGINFCQFIIKFHAICLWSDKSRIWFEWQK